MDAYLKLRAEEGDLQQRRERAEELLFEITQAQSRVSANLSALLDVAVHFGVIEEDQVDQRLGEADLEEWRGFRRQAAVLRALQDLGRPAHLKKIQEFLRSKGRNDDHVDLISAALSALRSKGEAEPLGGGVWVLAGNHDVPHGLQLSPGGVSPDDLHYNVFANDVNDAEVG
jgi:hypothetical protein